MLEQHQRGLVITAVLTGAPWSGTSAEDGAWQLCELTVDLSKDQQPTGNSEGPNRKNEIARTCNCRFELFRCLATSHRRADKI